MIPSGCVPVPARLLLDIEGRKGRLAVYAWLQCVCKLDQQISVKELASLCKMSEDNTRLAIRWLCDTGWLRVEAIPGSANNYIPHTVKQQGAAN
jgi:hypothetical protein